MSVIGSNILAGASGQQGYNISRSVRLRNSASAYLNRTFGSNGNQQQWTWSGWIKAGRFGSQQPIFNAYSTAQNYGLFAFSANAFIGATDTLKFYTTISNVGQAALETAAVFRDPSAWYHVVLQVDTTQATSTNRIRIYVNGVLQTLTGTQPSQNANIGFFNTTSVPHQIGALATGTYGYFDGYFTEINFIDGQALTPSSFGETNTITGVWQPKKYTGTYGTNGFYLNFSNPSAATAAAIGADYSGNGNNWTPNNISVTAGITYDSMLDVPTQWIDGGNGRGNYSTLNPLAEYGTIGQMGCLSGNLVSSPGGSTTNKGFLATIGINVGMLVYAEATFTTTLGDNNGGVALTPQGNPNPGDTATSMRWGDAGFIRTNNVGTAYGSALVANDVVMMAVNYESATSCKVWIGKNGTWFASGNPATGANPGVTLNPAAVTMFIASYHFANLAVSNWTFGQRPFAYTPPTGFKALNTLNLPQPTILKGNQFFDATTFTATGTTQVVTNSGFQPDFLWFKRRNAVQDHFLFTAPISLDQYLSSNTTAAEATSTTFLDTVNADGFTMGTGNFANTSTVVCWNWRAGVSAVTNTAGSITSTVDAGTTQGFSIVTYTGNGTGGATVGHGLGVAPSMVIVKSRSSTTSWFVAQSSLATNANLLLNTTDRAYTNSEPSGFGSGVIGGLSSTTFQCVAGTVSPSNVANINANGTTYVAYCFAAVAGFSAFGSYTGNGSTNGAFIYLGFRPEFVLVKQTNAVGNWIIWDTARSTYNQMQDYLSPNNANAESNNVLVSIDALSNGFKCRTADDDINGNGDTYIYMAFAENPFKNSLAR
jgi:hypothetical protein